jgi:hypothetical protein
MPRKIVARYTGEGYVFGVPARDLNADEWSNLSEENRKIALSSGTHQMVQESPKSTKKEVNDNGEQ